jgi:hypothetical protein
MRGPKAQDRAEDADEQQEHNGEQAEQRQQRGRESAAVAERDGGGAATGTAIRVSSRRRAMRCSQGGNIARRPASCGMTADARPLSQFTSEHSPAQRAARRPLIDELRGKLGDEQNSPRRALNRRGPACTTYPVLGRGAASAVIRASTSAASAS